MSKARAERRKQSEKSSGGNRTMSVLIALAVVGFVAIVAYGLVSAGNGPTAAVASAAPDFEFSVYQADGYQEGDTVRLSDLQGRPVVLNFFAGACPPCRAEMPDLEAVSQQFADDVVILGIDVGPFMNLGTRDQGQELLDEIGVTYDAGTIFASGPVIDYNILGMPSTYFIRADGTLNDQWTGLLQRQQMVRFIEDLVAASA